MLAGQGPFTHRAEINHLEKNICQAAWEMHSIFGCLHACDYCHVEDFVNVMLNIEALISDLQRVIVANPLQQLYKYDNLSDIFAFEPEYNACLPLIEFFARTARQYLLLYSKSDNIDFLLKADHKGHTIINWSISPASQASLIEKGAPPLNRRIKAMEKCQKAGYTVRARFSPLIPIRNWEQETAEMVKSLFDHVMPDVITVDVIGFMSPKVMREAIDTSLFDPEAVKTLEEVGRTQRFFGKHTFPHAFRLAMFRHVINEIRKYAPSLPISVCNETTEMWHDLGDLLAPMTPENYVCCCGPTSVPGHPMLNR
jgi:spore photoproduct lyase